MPLPALAGMRRHACVLTLVVLAAAATVSADLAVAAPGSAGGAAAAAKAKKKSSCRVVKVAQRRNGKLVRRGGRVVYRKVRLCATKRCTLAKVKQRTKSGKVVRRRGKVVYRKVWKCKARKKALQGGSGSGGGGGGAGPGGGAPPVPPQTRVVRPCSVTVSSVGGVQSAVAGASPGAVVCLADGSYGQLSLNAAKAGEVTIQPVSSGGATVDGAVLGGSNLTLEGFVVSGDEVTVQPGSDHMTVQFNRITGGYFGVQAGPTTTTTVDDVTIRGNRFVGPFGEDAIRLNRYHDGPDADLYGALIEGNEFTNVRENGNHSDCLQAVWVGDHLVYRRNYLHDNRCQGFFVKDQDSAVDSVIAEDNLFLRNDEPCDNDPGCGPPAPFQVWGPVGTFRGSHNTVWTGIFTLRNAPFGSVLVTDSVLYKPYSDTAGVFDNYTASNIIACDTPNRVDYPLTGITRNCSPPFIAPAQDDYRLPSGQGVTWRPADQHYGP